MRNAIQSLIAYSFLSFSGLAIAIDETSNSQVLVSIGIDALPRLNQPFRKQFTIVNQTKDFAVLKMSNKELPRLSNVMHSIYGRCGGYIVENSIEEAMEFANEVEHQVFAPPVIHQKELVAKAHAMVDESNLRSTIEALSSYRNRYYTSQTGVHSQEWVGAKWTEMTSSMPNVDLQYFEHADYPQRSVILTVKGSTKPNEVIVVGAHGDSIAGWSPTDDVDAPGADDDASGLAVITEALRIMNAMGVRPDRTMKFISYAAEEVGLRGSSDVAQSFRDRNENVVGVMQLDMTNFTTRPKEIVLMTDYTDARQNSFIKNLIKTYLPKNVVKEDRCGYACSDHASWSRRGYPASIPFESRMREYNKKIHSAEDTIAASQNSAIHSVNYAKILLAYLMEMGLN